MMFRLTASRFLSLQAWGLGLVMLLALAQSARAAVPVKLTTSSGPGYVRILAQWPEGQAPAKPGLEAHIVNGVLVAHFDQPFESNPKVLRDALPQTIALARMDMDGQTLRLALRGPHDVYTSRSYNVFAIDLVEAGKTVTRPPVSSPKARRAQALNKKAKAAAQKAALQAKKDAQPGPALPLKVRAAQTSEYTRIAFDWTKPVGHSMRVYPHKVRVTFDERAIPDIAPLNISAPLGLMRAQSTIEGGKTLVDLDLAPGYEARLWEDNPKVLVDIIPIRSDADAAPSAAHPGDGQTIKASKEEADAATPALAHLDPTPASGVVNAQVSLSGSRQQITFDFAASVGASAFRRANTIWIVFDDDARLDISELQHGAQLQMRDAKAFQDGQATGLRFTVLPSTQIEAAQAKSSAQWTFTLGEKIEHPPLKLAIHREADGSGPGMLVATLKNATAIHHLKDPQIGDTLAVVTALGPAAGVQSRLAYVEVTALPSSQGLAFEINADDVDFKLGKDQAIISTQNGLSLTPLARPRALSANAARSSAALPAGTSSPGFIDFAGWAKQGNKADFNTIYESHLKHLSVEETDPQARISMAKFLIANGLGAEALGILTLARKLDPLLVRDAQFRALRGTANVLMNRIKDARADFAAQTLNRDPSAALWRGYTAAQMEDWKVARREFEAGREAFYLFTPAWQARFRNSFARAALELNDMGAAKRQIDESMAVDAPVDVRLETHLIRAAYAEATGNTQKALRLYELVADGKYEPLEARAMFESVRLKHETGALTALQAADQLENIRYRWRGDNTELEGVRALGQLYVSLGDYRRALESMNTAVLRFPNRPVTQRLADDMHKIFQQLFLEGGADQMDPVQALALFYQFIDLVPIGADGDRMLRRLADRLIDFDLLPQAETLLQHQVDSRLRGLAKAQIATKLAVVYLMDHKPEKAMAAINASRQVRLPKELNRNRRLVQARALTELGRSDDALDWIAGDRTKEAALLRAEISWRSKDWKKAAKVLMRTIRKVVPQSGSINADQANLVLRAAIALSLNNDQDGLEALRKSYGQIMKTSDQAEAFNMVTDKLDIGSVKVKDLASTLADTQGLRAFLERYRKKNKES